MPHDPSPLKEMALYPRHFYHDDWWDSVRKMFAHPRITAPELIALLEQGYRINRGGPELAECHRLFFGIVLGMNTPNPPVGYVSHHWDARRAVEAAALHEVQQYVYGLPTAISTEVHKYSKENDEYNRFQTLIARMQLSELFQSLTNPDVLPLVLEVFHPANTATNGKWWLAKRISMEPTNVRFFHWLMKNLWRKGGLGRQPTLVKWARRLTFFWILHTGRGFRDVRDDFYHAAHDDICLWARMRMYMTRRSRLGKKRRRRKVSSLRKPRSIQRTQAQRSIHPSLRRKAGPMIRYLIGIHPH